MTEIFDNITSKIITVNCLWKLTAAALEKGQVYRIKKYPSVHSEVQLVNNIYYWSSLNTNLIEFRNGILKLLSSDIVLLYYSCVRNVTEMRPLSVMLIAI